MHRLVERLDHWLEDNFFDLNTTLKIVAIILFISALLGFGVNSCVGTAGG